MRTTPAQFEQILAAAPDLAARFLPRASTGPTWARALGPHLWDHNGDRWLDAAAGAAFLGRNHPGVSQALADVLSMDLPNLCVVNASALGGMLAGRLIDRAGGGFGKVSFANSGSETTEVALRFCRQITRRRRFLYLKGAMHGRSTGAISVCDWPELRANFEPAMPTTMAVPIDDIAKLRKELRFGDVAGLIVEPVQSMTGHAPDAAWLREAELLCEQYGTILVVSEVMTGLGRTGSWFHSINSGVRPGILTVGGALCGGQTPVGAVLVSEPIYERIYAGFSSGLIYFSTFAENNLAMAAGIATLDALEAMDAPTVAADLGAALHSGLQGLAARAGASVHGAGLLAHLHLPAENGAAATRVAQRMADQHIALPPSPPGSDILRFQLPVVAEQSDIVDLLESLENALFDRIPPKRTASGPPELETDVIGEVPTASAHDASSGPVLTDVDILVVGTGPGGTSAAIALAEAGRQVLMVEAGNGSPVLWDGGLRATRSALPAPSIRGIGGGMTVASLWTRPDGHSLQRWRDEHGMRDLDADGLAAHATAIETWWDGVPPVAPTDARGLRFSEALGARDLAAEPVRIAPTFQADRLAPVLAAGGTIIGNVEITALLVDQGRVAGATGTRPDGSHVRIHARHTVLAAGAVGTALLLQGHAPVSDLRFHLEGYLLALLPDTLGPWPGPLDAARTTAWRQHGFDVDVVQPNVADIASRFGADPRALKRALKKLDRMVALRVRGDAEGSTGRVRSGRTGLALDWAPTQADVDRMVMGLTEAARLLVTMGAETVWAGASGLPEDCSPEDLVVALTTGRFAANDLGLRAIHPHGTAAMGSVTRKNGAVLGIDDLWVADASLLPSSPGADPVVTVMALGHAVGCAIAASGTAT